MGMPRMRELFINHLGNPSEIPPLSLPFLGSETPIDRLGPKTETVPECWLPT